MKKQFKKILLSIMTVATCLCTLVGSTLALFTSESKVNIAVTSGTVKIDAVVKSLTTYSMDYETPYDSIEVAGDAMFENGGKATWSADGNSIVLNGITPGDKAELILSVENKSDVDILFKAVLYKEEIAQGEKDLFDALEVSYYSCNPSDTVGQENWEMIGASLWGDIYNLNSNWKKLSAPSSASERVLDKIKIEILLPEYVKDDYQNTKANLLYKVEALQGNAPIPANELKQTEDGLLISGDGALTAITEEQKATLTEVVVPEGVTTISSSAFRGCQNLKTVELPASVDTISNNAFNGTPVEEVDLSKTKITEITNQVFVNCKSLTSVELPETLTTIGNDAFNSCTSLTSIDLPDSLETLGKNVFYNSGLTEIKIPSNVSNISDSAFSSCANLTKIEFEDENATVKIGGYFGGFSQVKEIVLPKNTTISEHTFRNNSNLERVVFKGEMNQIPDFAFSGCKALKSIVFEQNTQMPNILQNKTLSKDGTNAFLSAPSEITIVMPNYVGNEGDTQVVGYTANISGTVYERYTTLKITKVK